MKYVCGFCEDCEHETCVSADEDIRCSQCHKYLKRIAKKEVENDVAKFQKISRAES